MKLQKRVRDVGIRHMTKPKVDQTAPLRPPAKTPPILFEKTQAVLREIEKRLGHRLLTYWNSTNGSICNNDVIGLYGIVKSIGGQIQRTFYEALCRNTLLPHERQKEGATDQPDAKLCLPSHSYPITLREAKRIGLNAESLSEDINRSLFELNELYSEMGQSVRGLR